MRQRGVAILNNLLFHVYSSSLYTLLPCPNFICPQKAMSDHILWENSEH